MKIAVVEVEFDLPELSKALRLPEEVVRSSFRNGAGASPFTEHWGSRLYDYVTHARSNQPASDGAVALERLGDLRVSVKALTSQGVKFLFSRNVGVGRSSSESDLIAALGGADRHVVVDIRRFPRVVFYPLPAGKLYEAAHSGRLRKSGWSGAQLEKWVDEVFEVERLTVTLKD